MSGSRTTGRPLWATAFVALILAVGAAVLFDGRVEAVFGAGESDGADRDNAAPPTPVRIVEAATGRAERVFRTSGRIRAAEDVVIAAETAGRVAEVAVADAAAVAEGDILLRLADEDQRAARAAAEARLARAEADLARARELLAEDVAAEARVESARAEARAARAELASAEAALANLTVRAPFAGRVGFVDVSPGAYLAPGDPVLRLTTVDDLRIRFALPQRLSESAAPGAMVGIRRGDLDCGPAEIVALSPAMTSQTRSREAEARAPTGCGLRDGGFVSVALSVSTREDAVFAPQAAIRREGFESWLFTVEEAEGGPVARRAPVTLGVVGADRVEIREGLAAGARIVAEGAQRVVDGARLRPVEEMGAGSGE